jgi:hypothetical protein
MLAVSLAKTRWDARKAAGRRSPAAAGAAPIA